MNRLLRAVVFFLSVPGSGSTTTTSHGNTTTSITNGSASVTPFISTPGTAGLSSTSGNGTCPSRTVNYITHTLPRQCLRTNRVPQNSTTSAPVSGSHAYTTASLESTISALLSDTDQSSLISSDLPKETEIAGNSTAASQNGTEPTTATILSQITEATTDAVAEEEPESPLDNAAFLSFEDWKKQNLAKTGQSLDDIGRAQPINPNRPRPGINNALDTLGEDSEIDLDFTGFGGAAKPSLPEGHQERTQHRGDSSNQHEANSILRHKDAGKTCKERTNYASFDCSATILKSNKECKSASSVLVENKDSYMLNTCSAQNKFFIVQLCNDIQIDTVVLANYEFFSSSFRHFRVSVSDRYPVEMEKWKDLGTFEARNTREIQAFLIQNPIIWAKYLRVEFLSHYGTEYYCPISLLRVHGTTMIEDYRHQEYIAEGEAEEATLETEVVAVPPIVGPVEPVEIVSTSSVLVVPHEEQTSTQSHDSATDQQEIASPVVQSAKPHEATVATNASVPIVDASEPPMQVGAYEPANANMTCELPVAADDDTATEARSSSDASKGQESTKGSDSTASHRTDDSTTAPVSSGTIEEPTSAPSTSTNSTPTTAPSANASITTSISALANAPTNATAASTTLTPTNSTRSAPPAQPSQESFFKSFAKRLSQLESNSTLSLQYIEEQSRILREAFSKVEKRQVATTTNFLSQLNETVMAELHGFRQAYDQLWQSTVIELDGQREAYQREMGALGERLTMVADELVWQKRMGIVQSTLLLLCLAVVLFGGRGASGYLEGRVMQQFKRWEYSEPNSPSPESRSPVSLFRRKIWRAKTEPVGEVAGGTTDEEVSPPQSQDGPRVQVEPPSPPRLEGEVYAEESESAKSESEPASKRQNNRSRKKKKPPGWPQGERPRSPLGM